MNGRLLVVLVILAVIWGGWHVERAEQTKFNPPPSCQLWGGTWDIWHGWSCY